MQRRRWGSLRTALAVALAVSSLGIFAAFGGSLGADPASAQYEYGSKVTICHNGNTLIVTLAALDKFLAHGDTIGPCP